MGLPNSESGVGAIAQMFVTVVQICFHKAGREQFSQLGRIKFSKQNHVFLIKLAIRLLGHLHGLEHLIVNELNFGKNRFEFWIRFKWDIFTSDKSDNQRVQLFAEERGQKTCRSFDLDL